MSGTPPHVSGRLHGTYFTEIKHMASSPMPLEGISEGPLPALSFSAAVFPRAGRDLRAFVPLLYDAMATALHAGYS